MTQARDDRLKKVESYISETIKANIMKDREGKLLNTVAAPVAQQICFQASRMAIALIQEHENDRRREAVASHVLGSLAMVSNEPGESAKKAVEFADALQSELNHTSEELS